MAAMSASGWTVHDGDADGAARLCSLDLGWPARTVMEVVQPNDATPDLMDGVRNATQDGAAARPARFIDRIREGRPSRHPTVRHHARPPGHDQNAADSDIAVVGSGLSGSDRRCDPVKTHDI
jgi:hypothetical protein